MPSNPSSSVESKSGRWVPSSCCVCYGQCSIRVHVVEETVVKIEGNPSSPCGDGGLCAKGVSGIMMHYDPNRLNVPLKRTNPEKGLGIDPKWVEISWEEALDTVVSKLKPILEEDPKQLWVQGTTTCASEMHAGLFPFAMAFGTDTFWVAGGGIHCGSGAHELNGLMHASWSLVPDFKLCNYAIYFGASKGHGAGHAAGANVPHASDARARGMKLVVVDPMCNFASGKAVEWVPIRVGTDAALALAMCHVLVNELHLYDEKYLKMKTNGPYLIGPDRLYYRDKASGKPMVWDPIDGAAKTFDDPSIKDFALEGEFEVDGTKCHPGFHLLKEHVKRYSPEYASKLTTVPQATIRRLAEEFGRAARIGSTIVIDGRELPYRPVAAIYFRGSQGHVNCTWNCLAVELLNQLVGCADAPGGALGFNPVCYGHPESGRPYYVPEPDADGLTITGTWFHPHKPFPAPTPVAPTTLSMRELFPFAMLSTFLGASDREKWWSAFKIKGRPKAMINFGANSVMSVGNKDIMAQVLKDLEFMVSIDIFLNETTDFADIILPDTDYLERLFPSPNYPFIFDHPGGLGNWGWPIRQPVVKPKGQRREFLNVISEIAHRLGITEGFNIATNVYFGLKEPFNLKPNVKYTWEEVSDLILKNYFGEKYGLDWFKEHGVMVWPKRVEEVYWRYDVPVRVPIYMDMFVKVGQEVRKIAREFGVENDLSYIAYEPLPDWNPCPSHKVTDPQYDLWAFYYRDVLHTNSLTMENPWLDEASEQNPYTYAITLNIETGKRKGLRDGDVIWVESVYGRKVKGKLKLSQGIHPEGIGIAGLCGHWSRYQPVAKGKGVFFNELLEIDYEHMDPANLNQDLCVKVKVYKA